VVERCKRDLIKLGGRDKDIRDLDEEARYMRAHIAKLRAKIRRGGPKL